MQSLKRFSNNFHDKESEIQTEMNQQDLKNPGKTVAKRSSFNPFRKLGKFTSSCLKKLGILKEKKCDISYQIEPEEQSESEVESEDFSNKILVEIEVYLPIVDVENNTLIPPKFDRPIFKYRDIDDDKTSHMANKRSMINRTKKRNKFTTLMNDEQALKATDMTHVNSTINATKKENHFSTISGKKQKVKEPDMVKENSDLYISEKRNEFFTAIMDEEPLNTPGIVNENSGLHISKKESKYITIMKDVEKSISKVSQMLKFKIKRRENENSVIPSEPKFSSKMEQSNKTTSKETNNRSSPISLNSVKSKFLALKFPTKEKETKLKHEVNNIKQKNDLMNPRDVKVRLKSPMDMGSNIKSPVIIKPTTIKKYRISSTSSTSDTSSQLSSSHPVELCTLISNPNSITRMPKYKNERLDTICHKTTRRQLTDSKVNEIDRRNANGKNGAAEINNQKLMHEFSHCKSSQIMEKMGNDNMSYSEAKTRSKFSQFSHRFFEGNVPKRHLPTQVNTDYHIYEKPMSSCKQLPMQKYFLQKREMSRFSRSTATQIDRSRSTFRNGKERHQKKTGPNPSLTVAGRRRLLQLMKFDV